MNSRLLVSRTYSNKNCYVIIFQFILYTMLCRVTSFAGFYPGRPCWRLAIVYRYPTYLNLYLGTQFAFFAQLAGLFCHSWLGLFALLALFIVNYLVI